MWHGSWGGGEESVRSSGRRKLWDENEKRSPVNAASVSVDRTDPRRFYFLLRMPVFHRAEYESPFCEVAVVSTCLLSFFLLLLSFSLHPATSPGSFCPSEDISHVGVSIFRADIMKTKQSTCTGEISLPRRATRHREICYHGRKWLMSDWANATKQSGWYRFEKLKTRQWDGDFCRVRLVLITSKFEVNSVDIFSKKKERTERCYEKQEYSVPF